MPARPQQNVRDPDFVIAGAMRCGTTSLFHWLGHHPGVFPAAGKELHYFDRHYDRGVDWYRSHFAGARERQVCGEATPAYLFLPWARERMVDDLPRTRFIVSLRNPADRAWSHYWHNRERGAEPLGFAEAIAAETKRLREPAAWARFGYAARGRYAEQLEALFDRVGRERVLVLVFETELVRDPTSGFRRACTFLGLDDVVSSEVGRRVNEARHIRSPRVRTLGKRLPKPLRDAVGRLNSAPALNYRMPAAIRTDLAADFVSHNDRLATLLSADLSAWTVSPSENRDSSSDSWERRDIGRG